jgi:predicted 3-demethylubiquinone-9 3-methyltransferase (glyoxalase superfamily)
MQKITPFLWFNDDAEEAMNFYASVFKHSNVQILNRYPATKPGEQGKVMAASFELAGQKFMALNGGPMFKFTEAISMYVNCETQDEVDEYWNKLTSGGEESRCGWLKDKYGLSWQIVPSVLTKLLWDKDPKKSKAVMDAMLKMNKLDSKVLQDAYDNA